MGRKELIDEIIYFCIKYKIIKLPQEKSMTRRNVEKHLKYSWFVELLIDKLLVEVKYNRKVNSKRLNNLLLELEKVRLDLECDEAEVNIVC